MRIMIAIVSLILSSLSFASTANVDAANIKMHIAGVTSDNRYFLCLDGIGCLSMNAANHGKVFSILHSFDMNTIYVTDVNDFRVYSQGLPNSCQGTINTNQTITINGQLRAGKNGVQIKNLNCKIS